jgi:thiamine biosynthesis lipoprotein
MQNRLTILLLTALSFLSMNQVAEAYQSLEARGLTMGKIKYSAIVVTDDHSDKSRAAINEAASGSLQRVNELMSTYLEDSDISKFNAAESSEWQSVAPETAAVVARALEICELTDGAFDPTVGPAVNLWNFGPDKESTPKLPDEAQIAEAASLVGYQKIEVRTEPPALRKLNPKVQLDLSAIAKGYAVDRVGESLAELGFDNFMVEVGGEVFAKGERRSGGPWRVGVEKPENSNPIDPETDRIHRIVSLSNRAIATSGDYRNFFEVDGKRYSHTIDPKTCRPVNHETAIASIVAEDCMTADAMATAIMVMGHRKGEQLCKKLGYPLLTVRRNDPSEGDEYITNASTDFPLFEDNKNVTPVTESDPGPATASSASSSSILPVFIATFLVFCLMVLGMAIGAIFNNKPVTGSCGGLANMTNEDGESVCGICSKPTMDCPETQEA